MRRIAPREVRIGIRIAQVINGNNFDVRVFAALVQSTQHVAANAAVAVNSNLDRHACLLKNSIV
jgi:hypothetical protein